jgi:hypothetical protein
LEPYEVSRKEAAEEGFTDSETAEDLRRRKRYMHKEPNWDMGGELRRCAEKGGEEH